MAILGAKELEELVQEAATWYAETRQWLIERLEEGGYPYGQVKSTQDEQLLRYLAMTPDSWRQLFDQLKERYRGLPDAFARASSDIRRYRQAMEELRMRGQTGNLTETIYG